MQMLNALLSNVNANAVEMLLLLSFSVGSGWVLLDVALKDALLSYQIILVRYLAKNGKNGATLPCSIVKGIRDNGTVILYPMDRLFQAPSLNDEEVLRSTATVEVHPFNPMFDVISRIKRVITALYGMHRAR